MNYFATRSLRVFQHCSHRIRSSSQLSRKRQISTKPRRQAKPEQIGLFVRTQNSDDTVSGIRSFNQALVLSRKSTYSDFTRQNLWKHYQAAKLQLPDLVHHIPTGAWKQLWKSQSGCRPEDTDRLGNLEALVKDMLDADVCNTEYQQILHVEKLYANGQHDQALDLWFQTPGNSKVDSRLTDSPNATSLKIWEQQLSKKVFNREWLELGIRLYAASGKLLQSQRILMNLAKRFKNTDPRLVVYVIKFLNSNGGIPSVNKAWALFLDLMALENFTLTINDYKTIIGSFIDADAHDYAIIGLCQALKVHGKHDETHDTINEGAFRVMFDAIFEKCVSIASLHTTGVALLKCVPNSNISSVLLSEWIKRLKDSEDSSQIVYIIELMYENGVHVRPWQLNELLERWFQGSEAEVEEAQKLASKMIDNRNEGQESRSTKWLPKFLRRFSPAANSSTYIQLMKYYAGQKSNDTVLHIRKLLLQNSGFSLSEDLVRSILSVHLLMEDFEGAWQFFEHVIREESVEINLPTYSIIWKGLHTYLSKQSRLDRSGYASPRDLFKHMIGVLHLDKGYPEKIPRTMYERVIKCFCLADDTVGLYVALRAMKEIFNQGPSLKTIEHLVKHIAIQDAFVGSSEEQKDWMDNMAAAIGIFEYCYQEMNGSQKLLKIEDLCEMEAAHEEDKLLNLLTSYLKQASDVVYRQPKHIERQIEAARLELGLAGANWGS